MTTINKDKNRKISYNNTLNNQELWKISHKYSLILMNNKSKIDEIASSIYGEYINELKNKKLPYLNTKKNLHIIIWNTLLNNLKKNYNDHALSLQILHLTNIYNLSRLR